MRLVRSASVVLVGALTTVSADAVGNGQTTNALSFGGFPGSYSFQRASAINYNNGNPSCPLETVTVNGPLAPLSAEMAYIFRGPLNLLQFAVYQAPGASPGSKKKRSPAGHSHKHRHLHEKKHLHHHQVKEQKEKVKNRGYGDEVVATIDGNVVSFKDTWDQPQSAAAPPAGEPEVTATINGNVVSFPDNWDPQPAGAIQTVTNEAAALTLSSDTSVSMTSQELAPAISGSASSGIILSEVNNGRTTYSSAVTTICPSGATSQLSSAASSQASSPSAGEGSNPVSTGPGTWPRVAFFDAGSQTASGVAFTANNNMTM